MYLGTKLKKTRLINGDYAWAMSPSKYVQESVSNCVKHIKEKLGQHFSVPHSAPDLFEHGTTFFLVGVAPITTRRQICSCRINTNSFVETLIHPPFPPWPQPSLLATTTGTLSSGEHSRALPTLDVSPFNSGAKAPQSSLKTTTWADQAQGFEFPSKQHTARGRTHGDVTATSSRSQQHRRERKSIFPPR
eukprot:scaffold471_cov109-Alexandrium_tamarense.AAC.3